MSIKALKTIKPEGYELTSIQRNMKEFTKQLEVNPLLGGILLENITLTTGNNTVNHKLGRNIRGWIVVDKSAASDIYKVGTQPAPSRNIVLNSSAPVTVSLYVF